MVFPGKSVVCHDEISAECPGDSVVCLSDSVVCPSDSVVCPSDSVLCLGDSVVCLGDSVVCLSDSVVCPSDSVVCLGDSVVCPRDIVVCLTPVVCPSILSAEIMDHCDPNCHQGVLGAPIITKGENQPPPQYSHHLTVPGRMVRTFINVSSCHALYILPLRNN